MARKQKKLDKALIESFPASDPAASLQPAPANDLRTSDAKADMDHIDIDDEQEVRFWAQELAVDVARIKEAVDAVGNKVEPVRRYLKKAETVGGRS
ncbi:DUF3606 domain-containing protein [Vineibacter terrae]|uniref:DUF3606 domain-containing protein n=1 Tax=Vineibacter terrae TaxID=2586908 RepID=UPI002E31D5BC|nr:DUF3606 domain-containing protein [Vineibacter terrae]HEX2891854.1 DUF3606 domain-containing protein [Vineibacter terrae]